MRPDVVLLVFLKEVRETLRDRRSLAMMFGIPLVVYPLLILVSAGLTATRMTRVRRQASRIAVARPEAAPRLLARLQAVGSDLRVVRVTDPEAALRNGDVEAVVLLPPRFEADALGAESPRVRVRLDRSRVESAAAGERVNAVLERYGKWLVEERLRARGVPKEVVRPLASATEDVSTGDRRLGVLLGMLMPVMLFVTGALGAFYPALNAATAEREHGTLETLLVTPAARLDILAGKALLVLLCGLLAAGLNLVSMSLALWRTMSMSGSPELTGTISAGALALVYLAVAPTILLLSAGILVAALHARNYREAVAFINNVMFLAMAPGLIALADPKTTPGLLWMPLVNSTLLMRDVFAGKATAAGFGLALVSSTLYACLMLSLAARLFTAEHLVNPAWEPLSLRGLRGARSAARGGRIPAVDEALALFALSMLLAFYLQPSWLQWGLLPGLAASEILLVAGPALLFARLGGYRWKETFSLRAPGARAAVGGLLVGVGLVPWMTAFMLAQEQVWPLDPRVARAMGEALIPTLERHPVAAPLLIGLLAGVCEEVLYRGPIQAAFTRKFAAWPGIAVAALLFGAAHMYAQGVPGITLIGILFGWMVLRTGSLFPAIAAHFAYDAVKLGLAARVVKTRGSEAAMALGNEAAWTPFAPLPAPAALVLGALLLAAGWLLLRGKSAER